MDPEKDRPSHVEYHDGDATTPTSEKLSEESSDGRVRWTFRTVVATASLCAIWTGAFYNKVPSSN